MSVRREDLHTLRSAGQDVDRVMPVAAVLEGEFSVDWLEELTGLRATSILSVVERAAEQQELQRRRPGVYVFAHNRDRMSWLALLPEDERERCYHTVANILLRELPDGDEKAASRDICVTYQIMPRDADGL
jgi:hypothetical protein